MNNSLLAVEQSNVLRDDALDRIPELREREARLVRILESIREIMVSEKWSTLKEEVFDGLTERLTKDLSSESRKESPDVLKLNRLAGQLMWAEKYSDLSKLDAQFRTELTNLRTQLHGKKH